MMLYESEIRKSLSFLLKFSPFKETFQSLYDLRELLLMILGKNELNNVDYKDKDILNEDFWDFIDETLRNYKKTKEG
ncbi:MAG TPA: hypothetical protein GXX15_10005 [Clostridia bacterium]|jgi:hypothetical protein|nr:hypothetical protein [Clostridia bacterium]